MHIPLPRLANTLRLLGLLWLVVWPLYCTFGENSFSSSVGNLGTLLATLLIPTALAFVFSWGLECLPTTAQDDADATEDGQ